MKHSPGQLSSIRKYAGRTCSLIGQKKLCILDSLNRCIFAEPEYACHRSIRPLSKTSSRSLAVHDALDGIGSGEALVEHLVVVLKVTGVILEVVLLATEESVDLDLPGGVERLALELGAVTDVVLVAEILVRVGHVFAGVNVEVLFLLIVDLEEAGLS